MAAPPVNKNSSVPQSERARVYLFGTSAPDAGPNNFLGRVVAVVVVGYPLCFG